MGTIYSDQKSLRSDVWITDFIKMIYVFYSFFTLKYIYGKTLKNAFKRDYEVRIDCV
jgi:hypothetical protein